MGSESGTAVHLCIWEVPQNTTYCCWQRSHPDQHASFQVRLCTCAGTESGSSGLPVQSFHIAPPVSMSAVFRPPLLEPSIIPGSIQQAESAAAQQGQSLEPGSPNRIGRLRMSLPRLSSQRVAQPMIPVQLDISGTNLEDVTSLAVGSQQQSFAAHIMSRTWQTAAGQQHVEQVTQASSVPLGLPQQLEHLRCKLQKTWSLQFRDQRSYSTFADVFIHMEHNPVIQAPARRYARMVL